MFRGNFRDNCTLSCSQSYSKMSFTFATIEFVSLSRQHFLKSLAIQRNGQIQKMQLRTGQLLMRRTCHWNSHSFDHLHIEPSQTPHSPPKHTNHYHLPNPPLAPLITTPQNSPIPAHTMTISTTPPPSLSNTSTTPTHSVSRKRHLPLSRWQGSWCRGVLSVSYNTCRTFRRSGNPAPVLGSVQCPLLLRNGSGKISEEG